MNEKLFSVQGTDIDGNVYMGQLVYIKGKYAKLLSPKAGYFGDCPVFEDYPDVQHGEVHTVLTDSLKYIPDPDLSSWVPVSEHLPEDSVNIWPGKGKSSIKVLVTTKSGAVKTATRFKYNDFHGDYKWRWSAEAHQPIAWQPLPRAYREKVKED